MARFLRQSQTHVTLGILAFFIFFAWQSNALPLMAQGTAGSGFFPIVASSIGALCCLIVLLTDLGKEKQSETNAPQVRVRRRKEVASSQNSQPSPEVPPGLPGNPPTGDSHDPETATAHTSIWTSPATVALALLVAASLIPVLGIPVALGLLIIFLCRVVLSVSLLRSVIIAVSVVGLTYILFSEILSLQFPNAWLGI